MRNRFTNTGWLITIIIALIPVVISLALHHTVSTDAKVLLDNMGKLAGLAGISLFAWSVILSARLKILDRLFLGLDNTYRAHHIIGCIALILLLVHPMLLTGRYLLSSPTSAYEFIKPSLESPFRLIGELTLAFYILLMISVLYIKLSQKRLVLVMRLLGLLVFFGLIHALFVGGSDLTSIPLLEIYILGLVGIAAAVYIYRSLFHKHFSKFYNYVVWDVVHKGDIIELHLASEAEALSYLPGQFAFIQIRKSGVLRESHPFTISMAPFDNRLRFSIKQLGDYTIALSEVTKGQKIKVDGPYGTFSNKIIKNPRQIWIAGGIGVTPFLAMAEGLDNSQQIDLYYSVKTKNDAVYLDELRKDAKKHPNLRIIPFSTDKYGYLNADIILKNSKNIDKAMYMICGPTAMMKSLRQQLKAKGVSNKQIHTEEFALS